MICATHDYRFTALIPPKAGVLGDACRPPAAEKGCEMSSTLEPPRHHDCLAPEACIINCVARLAQHAHSRGKGQAKVLDSLGGCIGNWLMQRPSQIPALAVSTGGCTGVSVVAALTTCLCSV